MGECAERSSFDRGRYGRSIRLAEDWIERTGMTRSALARIIEVDHTLLGRFLNRVPKYGPSPQRPKMIKIVNSIFKVCSINDVIHSRDTCWKVEKLQDDDRRLLAESLYHLEHLRKECCAEEGLIRMGAPVSIALRSARIYRAEMCTNCLGTIACFIDKPEAAGVPADLLERNVERALALEEQVISFATYCKVTEVTPCATAYAGYTVGYCGYYLDDGGLVKMGSERMLKATQTESSYEDGIWPNSLRFLNRLVEKSFRTANHWSGRFLESAKDSDGDTVRETLDLTDFPALERDWETREPGILARLRAPRNTLSFLFAMLLAMLFSTATSHAANIRIFGEEHLENAIGVLEEGGLAEFALFVDSLLEELPPREVSFYQAEPTPTNVEELQAFLEHNRTCGVNVLRETGPGFLEAGLEKLHVNSDRVFDFRVGTVELESYRLLLIGRHEECVWMAGDINQDGQLDLPDALLVADYLFERRFVFWRSCTTPDGNLHPALYDLNGDRGVDLSDVVYGLTWRFLAGPPPIQGAECKPILECGSYTGGCGSGDG